MLTLKYIYICKVLIRLLDNVHLLKKFWFGLDEWLISHFSILQVNTRMFHIIAEEKLSVISQLQAAMTDQRA